MIDNTKERESLGKEKDNVKKERKNEGKEDNEHRWNKYKRKLKTKQI